MADLHPIVILPLEHKFKSVTYTCQGEGLCKDGYSYDAHAEKLLPNIHKSGNTKDVETKPAGWWKAQCAFRGLNQSGSIADMQLRLRESKKKMIPELKTAETQLNKEFKKQNKIARDGNWKKLKTAEEKAQANPLKYLSEAFPKTGTGRPANLDIIIVKIENRAAIAEAADKLGLESVSVDAPWIGNIRPSPDRWILVGRTRDAVWNQMREIERAAARSKENVPKTIGNQTPKYGASENKPFAGRTKQTARKSAPTCSTHNSWFAETETHATRPVLPMPQKKQTARKFAGSTSTHPNLFAEDGKDEDDSRQPAAKKARTLASGSRTVSDATESAGSWDVRGSYVIECPNIEDEWGAKDSELTLDVYVQNTNGRQQMFAMFNFIVVEGIMRFEGPLSPTRSQNENGKRKLEDSYVDQDGDVLMSDIPQYHTGSSRESAFYLRSNDKPTARRPTWQYRWRGEETGEGEIQLGSDRKLESITFSKGGKELSGTFSCDFAGKCNFTGLKVMSRPHDSRIDPEAQWAKRSPAAHEYARQARWR